MVKTNINIVLVMLLSGAALFTSCHEDFDWDDAHAPELYKDFTKVFVKEFGKPESGHQWGFDTPWNNMANNPTITKTTRASGTPVFAKMEYEYTTLIENLGTGTMRCITTEEHNEVYEWFSKHKITWETTTTEGHGVYFDGVNCTRHPEIPKQAVKTADLSTTNSLLQNTPDYWLENPYVGLTFELAYVWVQHVASYRDPGSWSTKASEESERGYTYENDEVDFDSRKDVTTRGFSQGMDKLVIGTGNNQFVESNDFNNGYGYGQDTSNGTYDNGGTSQLKVNGKDCRKNADLVIANGVQLSNFANFSSADGSLKHDKWILVYLKGRNYEGWYLGMDTEAGATYKNGQIPANGVCNDWIFKLSAAGGARNNARILCEDLGSKEGVNSSDIDYNDIVFDVDYETLDNYNNTTSGAVKITTKAAGGTLPLMVYYGDTPLFESHEFLRNGDVYSDQNRKKDDAFYKTMINTNAASYDLDGVDNVGSKSYTLFFNGAEYAFSTGESYNSSNKTHRSISGTPPTWEDIKSNIKIKVYRFDRSEYINGGSNNINEVEWVHVTNETGSAPVKICVPQNVKWLKERQKINLGYAGFNSWVKNSNELFWNVSGTINSDYLYNETN